MREILRLEEWHGLDAHDIAPNGATKSSHKPERQMAKAIMLGVGYGMGAESIAQSSGLHIDEARELLLTHRLSRITDSVYCPLNNDTVWLLVSVDPADTPGIVKVGAVTSEYDAFLIWIFICDEPALADP